MKIVVYSDHGEEFVPKVAALGSVGYDIMCPYDVILTRYNPFHFMDLGIIITADEVPKDLTTQNNNWGYFIVPRSSSSKVLLSFTNTIGVIDPTYSGPLDTLKVGMQFNGGLVQPHQCWSDSDKRNWGPIAKDVDQLDVSTFIKKGERIGQILFMSFLMPSTEYGGKLKDHPLHGVDNASRGGFGSTGK